MEKYIGPNQDELNYVWQNRIYKYLVKEQHTDMSSQGDYLIEGSYNN